MLYLFNSFLSERLQREALNSQTSEWQKVLACVPQGSILGPLLFFIFINDILANLECDVPIFADDTSLFSLVRYPNESSEKLGRDLGRVAWWAHQWKMSFMLVLLSKLWRFIFPRNINHVDTPPIYFKNLAVAICETHIHSGLLFDKRLSFDRHVEEIILRTNRSIEIITRLCRYLPRNHLLTMYRDFIRPHLHYGDVVYD